MSRVHRQLVSVFSLAALCALAASAWGAAEAPRPFERTGHVRDVGAARSPARATVAAVNGVSVVVVDDSWSALANGTTVTAGGTYTIGTDAFATIQAGIDAVDPGGTVKVLPGNYTETAAGRTPIGYGGPEQFGIFCPASKPGLLVEGVDASANPITSAAAVQAHILTNATDGGGPDGVWVDGDHVTLAGLDFGRNLVGANKTISVAGDDFTLRASQITDQLGGALYLDDVRFDAGTNTSHIQSYRVQDNIFSPGVLVSIQDGAGFSGPVSGRVITGNHFEMGPANYWPGISFNGSGTGIPWFVYPVGGATITGNTFVNAYPQGQAIRTRGTLDASQFDWSAYWNGNTFDRKAAVGSGPSPLASLTTYSYPNAYGVFSNCRRIGTSVQGEVDNAHAGDVVMVGAGAYPEQVIVDSKNVTILGAGRTATTIQSPATVAVAFTTRQPVIAALHAGDVEVRELTVDGMGLGNGRDYIGIGYWDAGGKVVNCDVTRVRDTPFSGAQEGVAINASNDDGGPYALEVGNCNVTDWQKGGIALNAAGLTVNVHDCTVTGNGPTGVTAQNGIQLWGSSGAITNCTVTGNYWTGPKWVAAGLLLFGPSSVNVSGCTLTGNQYSVYAMDASGSMNGARIESATATGTFMPVAVELYNSQASTLAMAAGAKAAAKHVPPPVQPVLDAGGAARASRPLAALSNLMSFAISGGCFTGPGVANTEGIDVYSEGADLQAAITGAEITGWDVGIGTGGEGGVACNANHDRITGNATAGYDFYGTAATSNLAQYNWWGGAGGPGVGGADAVLGEGVVSSPWLVTGADGNPGCGFTAGPDNVVSAGPAPSCLSQASTCVTIPVTIARTTSDPIRGYSVTFQLSSNLDLCAGTASVVQGSYLSDVALPSFQVVSNGGGSYTVDCAILGPTCGAVAPAGTLFTLAVRKNGGDGTGTITLGTLIARDCDNGPVAVSAGSPLNITIDTVSPSAPSALAAAQVKTGNDGDGTTRVRLTFTAPPATSIEVYRKGYGHYPEYDDAGGAAPVLPSAYANLAAEGWAPTLVTATGQFDETTSRDFWYYVAYAKDGCGNVSAVSNITGGTLNYHLGDVVDNAGPNLGDNLVSAADISRLGTHYGLLEGQSGYLNYLDVGPTTNYSVNARPTTDNRVGFEDLMMFAINFSVVSAPHMAAQPAAADQNAIALDVPALPAAGETFAVSVRMNGAGDVQGGSVRVAYDAAVVEPLGVEAGGLLQSQGRASVALSPEPGTVDFALLGTGGGLAGEGEVARVLFRVRTAGAAGLTLGSAIVRDSQNQPVTLGSIGSSGGPQMPARTELGNAFPNPAVHSASVQLSLAREGSVRVTLYDLAGRRVRTLVNGVQPAGVRIVTWNGRNDSGVRMAPGVYVMRLEAPGVTQSRRLQFLP